MPNRLEWKPSPEHHERRTLVIVANKSFSTVHREFRLVLVPFREQARQPVTCNLERPGLDSGTKLTRPDSAQGSRTMVCVSLCYSEKPLLYLQRGKALLNPCISCHISSRGQRIRGVTGWIALPFDPAMIRSTPVRLTMSKRTGGKAAARQSI